MVVCEPGANQCFGYRLWSIKKPTTSLSSTDSNHRSGLTDWNRELRNPSGLFVKGHRVSLILTTDSAPDMSWVGCWLLPKASPALHWRNQKTIQKLKMVGNGMKWPSSPQTRQCQQLIMFEFAGQNIIIVSEVGMYFSGSKYFSAVVIRNEKEDPFCSIYT